MIYGEYADISKLNNKIILRICLALLLTYEESFDFFWSFERNLFDKKMEVYNEVLIKLTKKDNNCDFNNEKDRVYTSNEKIEEANRMLIEHGLGKIDVFNIEKKQKKS